MSKNVPIKSNFSSAGRNVCEIDFYDDAPEVKAVLAIQGGGSWAIGSGVAAVMLTEALEKRGTQWAAITGTSGGAGVAATIGMGVNSNQGAAGAAECHKAYWNQVKTCGKVFGLHDFGKNPFFGSEDQWPNIPGYRYSALTAGFNRPAFGLATHVIKQMLDNVVDWNVLRNGPADVTANTVTLNPDGSMTHHIHEGESVCGDNFAASGGLKELGGHMPLSDMLLTFCGLPRKSSTHYDGAYAFNPALAPMISKHNPTDVFIITLHGDDELETPKSARDAELYTDRIHEDLTSLQSSDQCLFHIHEVSLRFPQEWNASSRLNTDPKFLETIESIAREQVPPQIERIMECIGRESSYRPSARTITALAEKGQIYVM